MCEVIFKNIKYSVFFVKRLTDDNNQEIWSDLNFDTKEISININTPLIELKKVFRALAIKIILLENKMLKHLSCEDIDKIASVLSFDNADTKMLECSFNGVLGGFFCSNFA